MIIRTPNTNIVKVDVFFNDELVDSVDSTVFLGITIGFKNYQLQCGLYIDGLANRLSSVAFAVKQI